jgi:hypothetical protein
VSKYLDSILQRSFLEGPNTFLPHFTVYGRSSIGGYGVIVSCMTGPQLMEVVSKICAWRNGAGRARSLSE